MATLPIRNLGQYGIIRDVPATDLPINAFSAGNNVRFDNGKVARAPIWRKVKDLAGSSPAFCYGVKGTSGFDRVVYAVEDGRVYEYTSGDDADQTPTGYTPISSVSPFTGAMLGEVVYINRNSAVPFSKAPGESRFSLLPNWDATWRCRSLRSYKDFMVALNVTKGAVAYPQMVKWSDLTLAGQVPASWDETSTTNSAGENIIGDLTSPLLEARCQAGELLELQEPDQVRSEPERREIR